MRDHVPLTLPDAALVGAKLTDSGGEEAFIAAIHPPANPWGQPQVEVIVGRGTPTVYAEFRLLGDLLRDVQRADYGLTLPLPGFVGLVLEETHD